MYKSSCHVSSPLAGNVYDVLPDSSVRSVSIVLMIIHQAFAYAMFIMPVHHMWEKLIKTHDKPYWIRLPSRLPVGMLTRPPPPPTPSVTTLDHAMCMRQHKKRAVALHALLGPLSVSCITCQYLVCMSASDIQCSQ